MNVQILLNLLNEVPNPENSEILFHLTDSDNGKESELEFWSSTNSSSSPNIGLWFFNKIK